METKGQLIDAVKEWVKLDNEIRNIQKIQKDKKKAKEDISKSLMNIMKENEIDCFDLKDGQIRYKKESKREALTQKTLLSILSKHPQLGGEQAEHLNQFVYDRRKVIETETITRKIYEEEG